MNKYEKAFAYMNNKNTGSYPSLTNLYDKIQMLDFKNVNTFETAILRCKADQCYIPEAFNDKFCNKTKIGSVVGMLEPNVYTKSSQAEFRKKVELFKEIIIREDLHLFDVELDKKIRLEYMKDLGT